MDLSFWSISTYRISWRDAIKRIDQERISTSCLISSITDPENSNFVSCWPLYRDGQSVAVQNSVIFLDELSEKFNEREPWRSTPPHDLIDEDGNQISQWETQISDVRKFLDSHQG
ncbi:hypothetical protein [Streptomyces sp. bgisy130]|uniref:hypothetical protein n=1 Tax=Streptomyces sp. bgisy130 TaxID=3413788 RepID=UPI003F49E44C